MLIAAVAAVMLLALAGKTVLDVNVIPDRNPLFVRLSDGSIRNGYTVRVLNKRHEARTFTLALDDLGGARLNAPGFEGETPRFEVEPNGLKTLKVFVTRPAAEASAQRGIVPLTFTVRDVADQTEARRTTNFHGPEQ